MQTWTDYRAVGPWAGTRVKSPHKPAPAAGLLVSLWCFHFTLWFFSSLLVVTWMQQFHYFTPENFKGLNEADSVTDEENSFKEPNFCSAPVGKVSLRALPGADQLCVSSHERYTSLFMSAFVLCLHTSFMRRASSSVCGSTFPASAQHCVFKMLKSDVCPCLFFPAPFLFQRGNTRRRGWQRRGSHSWLMIHWQLTWIRCQQSSLI